MSYSNAIVANSSNLSLYESVQKRLDNLTKPHGSLGRLEEMVIQYCLARNSAEATIQKKKCFVFAADHGITAEKVTPYPRDVTVQMVLNMLAGGAAISVMCRNSGVECLVVNMGVDGDFNSHSRLIDRSVGCGTKNFRLGCAMNNVECDNALNAGYKLGLEADADICAIGEMGIGNTSSASALYSLLLGTDAVLTVGRGTGAEGALLDEKRRVISESVSFHAEKWDGTPFDALKRVGGFEIAAMAGFIIGCSVKRIPVIIDGFIASVSALCALRMHPDVYGYLFWGHTSNEQFHKLALDSMNARPILNLDMRLGEGTGAILAMNIIEHALKCYHQMASFGSAGVSNRDN